MTNTPETDQLRDLRENHIHRANEGDIWELCESLERERNEAREQRDRLADSLKTIEWSNNSEWQSNCAKCALATLDQQL